MGLLIFTEKDCSACELLSSRRNKLKIPKDTQWLDVDDNPVLSDLYKIEYTPTLIGFRHGKRVFRLEGLPDNRTINKYLERIYD